ncbi:putative hydroxymethylpyrimidine transport system ATP-binding protein [Neobacillus bataviensis]|uniref:Putative hydroxymethylpyrimidine transport system ATP-binding protein n=1 Tax=Neobacillus bataviensis TaxID=220685 RepID=A0A561DY12_9BACI|nr:ABC transporter ATP-binding protein [Neobacillus bataviensis]TWE08264.1 putative hydroxymethylpyrimidine transport system ATP-binding protein [Neobacillus bataviensis]
MLQINELSYTFDAEKPIFEKISLDVKVGEFVSVIGASGSGKSTLFKLVTGLLEPQQGVILINGEQGAGKRLGSVGYMPQKDLLLPWRTVLDNVLLPLEVTKENKKAKLPEVREWLARFGLADYESAYPNELSGGMRQRVAFLRTLMTGKNLLLLDEPFGALDSMTKRNMHSWLLGLWGDLQKTVLFITHDLEEALLLSDRIYVLKVDGIGEWKVNLPRPRSSELIYEADFIRMRKELEWLIQHENN